MHNYEASFHFAQKSDRRLIPVYVRMKPARLYSTSPPLRLKMPSRTDQAWVQELRGQQGGQAQLQAHHDLANYLYVVAFNYLRMRQADINALARFAADELAALAQDFVQETLERLARDHFDLLATYKAEGSFTAWAAQIVRRQAAQELRKSYWMRRDAVALEGEADDESPRQWADPNPAADPTRAAAQNEVAGHLSACLDALPERYRRAFWRCVGEETAARVVAEDLGTTENAVYLLIYRAKKQLRECLQRNGIGPDAIAVFSS